MLKNRLTVVDFCTSKIVAMVAESGSDVRCNILGLGVSSYAGFASDGWNEPERLGEQIASAINDADKSLRGAKTHTVYVGVPTAFTQVHAAEATIQLKGAQAHVTEADIANVIAEAEQKVESKLSASYVMHCSPAWYRVDSDGRKSLNVVGQKGQELSVLISVAVADKYFVDDVTQRLTALGYEVAGIYSSAVGETLLSIPPEDRDRRAILIDVGYMNTDVMIAEGDALIYLNTINLGGCDITLDLVDRLNIGWAEAEEKIKRQFIYGVDTGETYEVGGTEGQPMRSFTRQQVADVILPRVDEIAASIQRAIDDSGITIGKNCAVYLTGGGLSYNRGGRDYLSGKLGRPVREVSKHTSSLNGHNYTATLGLLDLIIEQLSTESQKAATRRGRFRQFWEGLLRG